MFLWTTLQRRPTVLRGMNGASEEKLFYLREPCQLCNIWINEHSEGIYMILSDYTTLL